MYCKKPELFSHKLCALLDRKVVTNRDIFDFWFFMQKQAPIKKALVEVRMNMSLADYLKKCIEQLESMSDKGLLNGKKLRTNDSADNQAVLSR